MEHILDNEVTQPIFQHAGARFLDVPTISRVALVVGLLSIPFFVPDWWISLVFFIIGFLWWWGLFLLEKSSYRVYRDRIEFFNKISPNNAEILPLTRVEKAEWNNISVNRSDLYIDLLLRKPVPGEHQDFGWSESVRLGLRRNVRHDELQELIAVMKVNGIAMTNAWGQKI